LADLTRPADGWTALPMCKKAELIATALAEIDHDRPISLGIGAHGCDSDEECAALQQGVAELVDGPVAVVNDAMLLQYAAGVEHSVNLVLGTGSIAVATGPTGTLYAGGWGWLLGDPGSAWGLVRTAVMGLTAAQDKGAVDDDLLAALQARSGLGSLRAIAESMQTEPADRWAGWAPVVFEAADRGSPIAGETIRRGVDQVVDHVVSLSGRGARIESAVAGGGVITHQPSLEAALAKRLDERLGLTLVVVRDPPISGAVRLARRLRDSGNV